MSYSFNLDGPSSLNKNVPDVRYFFAQFRVNFEKFARSISVAFRVIASTHNTKYKRDFRISLAPIEFLTTAVLIKTYQNVRLHCPTIIGIFKFGRLPHFWQWRKSISKIGFACNDMALIWQTIFQPVGKLPHVTPHWPIGGHFDICVGYILSTSSEFGKGVVSSITYSPILEIVSPDKKTSRNHKNPAMTVAAYSIRHSRIQTVIQVGFTFLIGHFS